MKKVQGTFKLRVKILEYEFEAEGPPDLVRAQFEMFRLLMQDAAGHSHVAGAHRTAPKHSAEPASSFTTDAGQDTDDLKRIFRVIPHQPLLSLHQPPAGTAPEADAALLLLFGYKRLRNQEDVPVTLLNAALTQSGCHVKRLDRILKEYVQSRSIVRRGRGKGGKYRLTNLGAHQAERLIADLS